MKWKGKEHILKDYLNKGLSYQEIGEKLGVNGEAVRGVVRRMRTRGDYKAEYDPGAQKVIREMTEEEMREALSQSGYKVEKKEETPMEKKFRIDPSMCEGDRIQFAVISCTQLGNKYQQISYLKTFYQYIQDYLGIKVVLHAGDLIDGINVYRGQEYELFLHGADAQRDYAIEYYPKMNNGGKTYVIDGNHDYSFIQKANTNVLKQVAKERKDIEYLGSYGAYPKIKDLKIYLQHGASGVSYARSYRLQKNIEQMSPDIKPDLYFLGHYHTTCALFEYRNVTAFMLPCFQAQTPYLRRKGLYPEIGGFVFTVQVNDVTRKRGVAQVDFRFIPFFVPLDKDY